MSEDYVISWEEHVERESAHADWLHDQWQDDRAELTSKQEDQVLARENE